MATFHVMAGDTLSSLADYMGVSVNDLLALNPSVKDKNVIYVNQVLNAPATTTATKFATAREIAWNGINSSGSWGAYGASNTPNVPMTIDITGGGSNVGTPKTVVGPAASSVEWWKNPLVLAGGAMVLIAIFMSMSDGKKKK